MSKELKVLLESELLNEETKKELQEAFDKMKEEAVLEAKNELEVEYAKKLLKEKQEIAVKMQDLITEAVVEEIKELKEDIEYYKDIEPKYAQKLEEFKKEYAEKLEEAFEVMVQESVHEEIEELREDLMEARNNYVGLQIFESFKDTFEQLGVSDDTKELKKKFEETKKALQESQQELEKMKREKIMESVLSNLSGSKREVMKTILENVETDKIEQRYNETIDSVLNESSEDKNKGDVITESEDDKDEKLVEEIKRLRALIGN